MGFTTFVANPKSYLKTHDVIIQQNPAVLTPLTATPDAAIPTGGTARRYDHNAGQYVSMIHSYSHAVAADVAREKTAPSIVGRALHVLPRADRTFAPVASNADVGVRFLPYNPGCVTYMPIDAAATFAITGPLTGCTVAAGKTGGTVWFFHSFTPGGLHGAVARTMQRQMISHVQAQLGLAFCHIAENGAQYDGQGFVFGRRRDNGRWKFYAYGSDSGITKFADL
ncbi:MAG: hypothetical protein ACYTJ0_02780 [Planctomycetota bacterium]|jgi:hypothetical protein